MSLFSKFTSMFQSNTSATTQRNSDNSFQLLLDEIMCPYVQFDLKSMAHKMANSLIQSDQNIEILFQSIQNQKLAPGSTSFVQLLAVIHQLFHCSTISQEISIHLRDCRLGKIELEDQDNLQTEPDLNLRIKNEQCYTESNCNNDQNVFQFSLGYFNYLQHLAVNIDLYKAACKNTYPYLIENEIIEPKLMFLWHYKIQNLINTATSLLKQEMFILEIQKYLYLDIWRFQKFICNEVEKMIDQYITLPNSDALSLYEIYLQSNSHYQLLKQFQESTKRLKIQLPAQSKIENIDLQEFLNFISKLKVLNQMTFKKSLKVPTKMNPCMGIPLQDPKLIHLRSTSGQGKFDLERLNSEESLEQEDRVLEMSEQKKKVKKIHFRGQSTFQTS